MKGTCKDRRSRRIPAAHRMLLTILGPTGSEIVKEIVSTVELSQFGARVRGRRSLRPEAEGMLTQLRSGRQARIRIAWQIKPDESAEFLDTGVEILSGFDYWGISFAEPESAPPTALNPATSPKGTAALAIHELLADVREKTAGEAGTRNLEILWCGLIEHLERRQLITRDDLTTAIRSIAESSPSRKPDSLS